MDSHVFCLRMLSHRFHGFSQIYSFDYGFI